MSKKRMNVKAIHGRIRLVSDSDVPDFRVKVVKRFPDLEVQVVDACPDGPGKWQVVEQLPDYKVLIVDRYPDFKIKCVNDFPGLV
ncbi:MAG TPA: hypothetical protein VHY08_19875 [Bacillota bacterium]|nr:hypothetical protein [Bacillota bacterium]